MTDEQKQIVREQKFKDLYDRIEELRKDVNYYDQQVNNRINVVNTYLSREIAKVVLDNATRDGRMNELVQENKQLKKEIENLNKNVNRMCNQIDRLERDKLYD